MWQQMTKMMALRRLGVPLGAIILLFFLFPRKAKRIGFLGPFAVGTRGR